LSTLEPLTHVIKKVVKTDKKRESVQQSGEREESHFERPRERGRGGGQSVRKNKSGRQKGERI